MTKAPRRTVTREQVLHAAIELLDRDGVEGLSMANLASHIGFTTMAVYRHVENRDDLIDGVVRIVLRDVVEQVPTDVDWLDGVVAWMDHVRRCLQAHPWAARMLGTASGPFPPWREALGPLRRHFVASPLSTRDQARAYAWVSRLTIGIMILELGAPAGEGSRRRRASRAKSLDPDEALLDEHSRVTNDDVFADAVRHTRTYLASLAGC